MQYITLLLVGLSATILELWLCFYKSKLYYYKFSRIICRKKKNTLFLFLSGESFNKFPRNYSQTNKKEPVCTITPLLYRAVIEDL